MTTIDLQQAVSSTCRALTSLARIIHTPLLQG
jgi:hypothetical protein